MSARLLALLEHLGVVATDVRVSMTIGASRAGQILQSSTGLVLAEFVDIAADASGEPHTPSLAWKVRRSLASDEWEFFEEPS